MENQKPLTAGQMAGRLAARELEPLLRYVEETTGVNLRKNSQDAKNLPKTAKQERQHVPALL